MFCFFSEENVNIYFHKHLYIISKTPWNVTVYINVYLLFCREYTQKKRLSGMQINGLKCSKCENVLIKETKWIFIYTVCSKKNLILSEAASELTISFFMK